MEINLLSPKSDFIFKLIFGDQRNVDILAAFLQSVLDLPEKEYTKLTVVDPHLKPETADDKLGILDVKIHTKSGKVINVEIQVSDIPQMRERIAFYTAKMVTEQISKGEDYAAIRKVISIVIADYRLIQENESYHNRYRLYDIETGSQFTDMVEVNVLELPKLPGENDSTELWEWMLFLKSTREEDLAMLAEKNPQIKKAVGVLKELSQDERTRLLYEEREKARRDYQARVSGAFERGLLKGRNEGVNEGLLKAAKNLLQMKMTIQEIIDVTGLSREEIKNLSKTSNLEV